MVSMLTVDLKFFVSSPFVFYVIRCKKKDAKKAECQLGCLERVTSLLSVSFLLERQFRLVR